MTNGANVLHLLRRRWYYYAVALVFSVAAVYGSSSSPRVYTAEVLVSFEPPVGATLSEDWVDYTETLITYSQVIDMTYNTEHSTVDLSSPRATLFGNGLREGLSVEILTSGNQWVKQLDRPVIVVNVSSTDLNRTLSTVRDTATQLADISDQTQADAGIPPDERIVAEWDEQETAVGSFGRTRQATLKGAVMLTAAATLFATMLAFMVDRRAALSQPAENRESRGPTPGSTAPATPQAPVGP